jgi:type IV pilus assembly protein PilM
MVSLKKNKKTKTKKKGGSIVGLDIESGSIAATESPGQGGRTAGRTAIVPLEPGVVREGEVQDMAALTHALADLFSRHKLSKNVRLGIANQRVVVRTLQLPRIEDREELESAVRFRAEDAIPMPLDQAVLDHRVIGRSEDGAGNPQLEVLAVAARRDMIHPLVGAIRDAGLRPEGIDLSAFGMIRALGDQGAVATGEEGEVPVPATLYGHLGDVTNIAVARGDACLFTRVSPFGVETIADRLASREGISLDEARELLIEVGLEEELDAFDEDAAGAAREELERGAGKLIDELRMSMEFYGAQEGVTAVESVVVCGAGSTIPGLADRIQSGLGLGLSQRVPSELSHLDPEDAARLTVSYGLALEE